MHPKLSFIIPVHKEPCNLEKVLNSLAKDVYKNKEIIVIFDGPTKNEKRIRRKYKGKVKFLKNKENRGKVYSLNRAIKEAKGDILVFLDKDVEIEQRDFCKKIINEMRNADFLDIKKIVTKNSLLAKFTYYEYLGMNIGSFILSKTIEKIPSVNGSAFVIKKEIIEELNGFNRVICEDMDIAMRCAIRNIKMKHGESVYVKNHVPSSLREWFKQRLRWSIGTLLWIKKWRKEIIKFIFKNPVTVLVILLFFTPSIMPLILSLFFKDSFLPLNNFSFQKLLIFILLSFFISFTFFKIFSKKLKMSVSLAEFFGYFFIYSPMYILVFIRGIFNLLIKNFEKVEWKV